MSCSKKFSEKACWTSQNFAANLPIKNRPKIGTVYFVLQMVREEASQQIAETGIAERRANENASNHFRNMLFRSHSPKMSDDYSFHLRYSGWSRSWMLVNLNGSISAAFESADILFERISVRPPNSNQRTHTVIELRRVHRWLRPPMLVDYNHSPTMNFSWS